MLLVGAGLLLRSFANLQRVPGGFSTPPRQILTMLISPGNRNYNDARAGLAFYDEVLDRAGKFQEWKRPRSPTRCRPTCRETRTHFRLRGRLAGGLTHSAHLLEAGDALFS